MIKTFTREFLYNIVWSKPTTEISKEYRISTNDVRKLCKYYNIPLPLQGHWQKIKHNKPSTVIHLPESDELIINAYRLVKRNEGDEDIPFLKSPFQKRVYEIKKDKTYNFIVPSTLKKPHPLILKTKNKLEEFDKLSKTEYHSQGELYNEILPIHTDKKMRSRALRIMNTIITNLYKKNYSVSFRNNSCFVEMFGQKTEINLRQKINRVREKDERGYGGNQWLKTDKLEFQAGPSYSRKNWIDGKNRKVEDVIPEILVWIEQNCQYWHDIRKKQAEEKRIQDIENEKESEKIRVIELESKRFETLISDSEKWHKAAKLRSYIKAVENKAKENNRLDLETKKWIEWARKKADRCDPLIETEDDVFNGIDKASF